MATSRRMTVIAIRAPGGPEMLVPEERPVPQLGSGEVLVKVAAAGVNRPDVMQRQGLYPPPQGATDIPGLEIAGEVVALGAGVKRWKLGDQVMALVVGGGYAQYCPAHESHCLPVPARPDADRGRGDSGDLLHRLAQRLRARPAQVRRDPAGARRLAPASAPPRSSSPRRSARASSPPPARRRNARPAASSAPTSPSTTRPKISSPPPRPRPAATAPTSSSTWSAATTSSATTRPPRSTAASCRSPSRAARRPPSTSAASCSSACTHTGSTLRARSVAGQGRDRARGRGACAAADCRAAGQAGDRQHLPAAAGRRRPCPHGIERAYRQDRADGLSTGEHSIARCVRHMHCGQRRPP